MANQDDTRRKSRRDLLLILLFLPFGVLCMFMTGQTAITLAPNWILPANMLSNLDPNAIFAGLGDRELIEPLNPGILTQPAWDKLFLTPNASIPTREVAEAPTPTPFNTPPPPPPPVVNTPVDDPEPTATFIGGIIPTRPAPQRADLGITKTDNSNTYTPGTTINYTLVVRNHGPDDAPRFNIVDNIPSVITGLVVNCTPATYCGTNTSSGNTVSFTTATLPPGDQLTVTVSGIVASGATGVLSNSAEVYVPQGSGYRDDWLTNNIVTDTDTQLSVYDVAVTKSDGIDTFTAANAQFDYLVEVSNSGPSDAIGITINDAILSGITSWGWCIAPCTPDPNASTTDFSDTVTVPSGGSIQYSVAATRDTGVVQSISNTASLTIPSGPGVQEQNPANNTATDTNIPLIDLQITKDDGVTTYTPGGAVTYTVVATNNSTFDLSGVSVTDDMPILISSWTWTCTPDPGGTCTASGTGNINDLVDLPALASVTYTIVATVHPNAAGTIENTASVTAPVGLTDAVPGNNTATDLDVSAVGEPDVGPPDGVIYNIPEGSTATFFMNQPIVANGGAAADFVFYESPMAPGIHLDHIIIELSSDGSAWSQVFYWGDGIADTNTNVDINLPNIASACTPNSTEEDNCPIASGDLFNNTGIAIDIDTLGLSGSYPWIRFTAPPGSGDAAQVDAIQILP